MNESNDQQLEIGRRLRLDGHAGTVKYIGSVDGQKGDWIGVDWDDSSRGKHDGTVKGKQYFKAREQTSGSFLRASKIPNSAFGVDLIQAASERYSIATSTIHFDNCNFGSKSIELVGMSKIAGKQHTLSKLSDVVLDSSNLDRPGNLDIIATSFTNCHLLDVGASLINRLQVIIDIANALPNLKSINCRGLAFTDLHTAEGTNKRITELILNHCSYKWSEIVQIVKHFARIESLGLMHNSIDAIDTILPQSLKSLDLEDNPIADWSNVASLGNATNLRWLNLARCPLESIHLKDGELANLEEIILRQCKIGDWQSINDLAVHCRNLKKLILIRNPIYGDDEKRAMHNRQLVVGRFPPTLTHIDRELISKEERRGAYIDYIKAYSFEYQEAIKKDTINDFRSLHPFYERLIQEFGAANEAEMRETKATGALIDRTVSVTVIWSTNKKVEKRLPRSIMLSKLRALISRQCGIPRKNVQMYLEDADGTYSIALDNDSRQLQFYSVEDGNVIRVRSD